MNKDIEIKKLPPEIKVCGMAIKPVRGVTEEGKTIYEEDMQIELKNIGGKALSFVDCNLSYYDAQGEFIGCDSDGSLSLVKPNESVFVSIPMLSPSNTSKKLLEVSIQTAEGIFSKYISWVFLAGALVFLVYQNYSA
ncbi:hypothetical protein ACJJIR_01990 [Microbulbifer sp. SSSA008]|uniref:hypothetical protein n=1 Tax=Microbulbifer sp. SSSA008 TaxID=3243380 RepID=UPI0040398F15